MSILALAAVFFALVVLANRPDPVSQVLTTDPRQIARWDPHTVDQLHESLERTETYLQQADTALLDPRSMTRLARQQETVRQARAVLSRYASG